MTLAAEDANSKLFDVVTFADVDIEESVDDQLVIDHNDPSKPSHCLTNGSEPSKTIESDGSNIQKPS